MLRRLVAIGILPLAALVAQTTIVRQTGTASSYWTGMLYVSWTQSSAYSNVAIQGTFFNASPSSPGASASATAYLTTQVGSGTTTAQQVAATTFSTTSATPTQLTLFSGLSLSPGTYYLVVNLGNGTDRLGWSSQNGVTVTTAPGVTAGNNFLSFGTVAAYPPASSFGSKGQFLLYQVLGLLGVTSTPVPALGGWGMLFLAVVLGLSGLWLVRKHAKA